MYGITNRGSAKYRSRIVEVGDDIGYKRTICALVGNPNCGKTTLFNKLTGLNQSIGNYPGVTVDKKKGSYTLQCGTKIDVIDFPGLYSLYPNAQDERLVVDILSNPEDEAYPDLILYVADANNLERHMLLATQIIDLKIPMIFIVNMVDIAEKQSIHIDYGKIQDYLDIPVVGLSGRTGANLEELQSKIESFIAQGENGYVRESLILPKAQNKLDAVMEVKNLLGIDNYYRAKIVSHHYTWLKKLSPDQRKGIGEVIEGSTFKNLRYQIDETMARYQSFEAIIKQSIRDGGTKGHTLTDRIDSIITHRVWGVVIFFTILLFIFQAIFSWSELPMTWIEDGFAWVGELTGQYLPDGWLKDLLVEGIIAGLGGIMVFIPQIAILFFLISILEETGYMARVVYMFDDIMRKFGLNGRSIVAFVSSSACAIPAIMSTRTITDWKERLTTIMVTPLISCNARIPVYTVLVGFAVPKGDVFGFNTQGLAFMGLYLLGLAATLGAALVFKYTLKTNGSSMLMLEMPQYKSINWKHALMTVKEKVGTFIIEAGKIILIMSIALWFLASYGPGSKMQDAEDALRSTAVLETMSPKELEQQIAAKKLEASYAGHIGKFIEPVIRPLGFDWKIGIALITSFAAREVFVGTMATIYSVGNTDDESSVRERMAMEMRPSGKPMYNQATAWSLLVFYMFALQCLSTLAVTKRETKSWKWPIIQFVFMGAMAYVGSFAVYTILS